MPLDWKPCDQETAPEGLYWFHVSTYESEEYVDEDGEIATRSTGRVINEVVLADHSKDGSRHSFQGFNAEKHGAMGFDNIHHYAEVERPDVP
ncbi:hypothetical protein FYM84_23235 [Pseudomonas sp. CAH-1]|uniref:hypothetical protein n=1 Tax=Pseudomonas TaxID=286 RepID=UPI00066DCF7B|nr:MULTISPECIES: hypothetical protein [Pseudomonas]MRT63496.1 hypothetical protein [Pseudomonas sp. CAH-1]CAH0650161.1 hypothetical protein PSNVIR_04452 [Pseudomonas sp. Nvir]